MALKKIGTVLSTCLVALAATTALSTPAHAEGEVTLQNVHSGRCLSGSADRRVRMGDCDGNAKWRQQYYGNSPMLVNVATGLCLDHPLDPPVGKQVYLSSCWGEDYGQLIGIGDADSSHKHIRPVDSSAALVGWDTGSVTFAQDVDNASTDPSTAEKALWATI
ncbi:RICIN domain-containing protein [Streptomyces sp. NPDC019531]|uniref:RICIN domain-containing protein n=1 Tax=Streptomyces sp. NPDC019531 TaxID=3365062 RepID=UPI00384C2971